MQIDIGVPYVPVQAPAINSGVSGKLITERRALVGAVAAINQSGALGPQRELSFLVDRATRRLVVRIVDVGSGEVVSQIPSTEVLAMASQAARLGPGSNPPQPSVSEANITA